MHKKWNSYVYLEPDTTICLYLMHKKWNSYVYLEPDTTICLYLMHKKWNSYMYLEPDTTIGNFEVRITTFILYMSTTIY